MIIIRSRKVFFGVIIILLSACNLISISSPDTEVRKIFENWALQAGIPYKDVTYQTISNDDAFATVRVQAKLKEAAMEDWVEKQVDIECRHIGSQWQCSSDFVFNLTEEEPSQQDQITPSSTIVSTPQDDTPIPPNVPTLSWEQPGLSTLEVDLWPEYDRPAMLVIYHITLSPEANLPADVKLRIPQAAQVNALAVKQVDGSLINIAHEQELHGDWTTISFIATTSEILIEYYDPGLQKEGKQRHYTFLWPGDCDVNALNLKIQRPYDAKNMNFSPGLDFTSQVGVDSLTYYRVNIGSLIAGQTFEINLDYEKSSEIMTTEFLKGGGGSIGDIVVEINNGSGGDVPPDLKLTLYGFDNTNLSFTETVKTSTSSPGYYTFNRVNMPMGRVFLAAVEYLDVQYGSDIVEVEAGKRVLPLSLTIYDATIDTSVLLINRLSMFFEFNEPNVVQVTEVIAFMNPTNQTVISGEEDGSVVHFTLPEGYFNLQLQDGVIGNRYVELSDGLADTQPVQPGTGNYLFQYDMLYRDKLEFVRHFNYPVEYIKIMLPDVGVSIDSDVLMRESDRKEGDTLYQVYGGENFNAGSLLKINLSGQPK